MRIALLLLAIVAAATVAALCPAAPGKAAGEIVTFASIVAAGSVSAMALCANLVLPERLNPAYAEKVSWFIRAQSGYWLAIFMSAIVCCLSVILGQAFGWATSVAVTLSRFEAGIEVGRTISFFTTLSLLLLAVLLLDFARAIGDIMSIGRRLTGLGAEPSQRDRISKLGGG